MMVKEITRALAFSGIVSPSRPSSVEIFWSAVVSLRSFEIGTSFFAAVFALPWSLFMLSVWFGTYTSKLSTDDSSSTGTILSLLSELTIKVSSFLTGALCTCLECCALQLELEFELYPIIPFFAFSKLLSLLCRWFSFMNTRSDLSEGYINFGFGPPLRLLFLLLGRFWDWTKFWMCADLACVRANTSAMGPCPCTW